MNRLVAEQLPLHLRQAERWTTGPAAAANERVPLCRFDEALTAGGERPRFVTGGGWTGVVLHDAFAKPGVMAVWAQGACELLQSFAETQADGRSVLLLLAAEKAPAAIRYSSSRFGYDIEFLPPETALELTGQSLRSADAGDRSAGLAELQRRGEQVAAEETTLESSLNAAAPGPWRLPGFGPIAVESPPHVQLPENRVNRLQGHWEFATHQTQLDATPSWLQIGRSNHCNLHCIYCGDHRPGNSVPRSKLDGAVWESLLAQAERSTMASFHGISEFFLDPEFFSTLARCAAGRVGLFLNTNATVCTPRHLTAIQEYPARLELNISIDAATPETYRRVRGWDFDRLMENVRKFVSAMQARRHSGFTSLSFVIQRSTVHEMTQFVEMAHRLGADEATFLPLIEWENLGWDIVAFDGGRFDYRQEGPSHFAQVFNEHLQAAHDLGDRLNLNVNLPSPMPLAGAAGQDAARGTP